MKDGIAMDEGPAPRKDLLRDMQNNGVRFCTETSVQEVTDHSVIVSGKVNEEIPADTVVLAIGDALKPGLAGAAIREGYLVGRHL